MTRVSRPSQINARKPLRHAAQARVLRGLAMGLGLVLLAQSAQAGVNDEFRRSRQGDLIRGQQKPQTAAAPALAFLPQSAAPSYAISGRLKELAATKVADAPVGAITALDVMMQDAMLEQRLMRAPVDPLLNPLAVQSEPLQPYFRAVAEQIVANQQLAATVGAWTPPADELRVLTFDAGIAAFIDTNVREKVKVLDADIDRYYLAHPELYLKRSRAQVRYIFLPAEVRDGDAIMDADKRMEALARRLRAGEVDFATAASENSAAPSASEGGLLPPFYNGTYFPEFERQVFSLTKPGEISESFRGPGGLYLVQLVQGWPPANIPIEEATPEIKATLQAEHVKHYYLAELEKLRQQHWNRNNSLYWEYMDQDAPIAQVGKQRLDRSEFLRYFPNPTDPGYGVLWPQVLTPAAHWLEGETVMQHLERNGLTDHPYIVRGRELALNFLRARRAINLAVPAAEVMPAARAIEVLERSPDFRRNLRQARVLQIQITPTTIGVPPSEQRAAVRLAETLATQVRAGSLPLSDPIDLKKWYAENVTSNTLDLAAAIDDLQDATKEARWPNITFTALDLGWQPALPGMVWNTALRNVAPGEVSPPQLIGEIQTLYLVLAEVPVSPENWGEKPLYLANMARGALLTERYSLATNAARPDVKTVF